MSKKTTLEQLTELLGMKGLRLASNKVEMKATGKLDDGTEIYTTADSFMQDAEVFVMDPEGNAMPAADGEYIVDGKMKITVASGKVTAAEEVEIEAEQELSAEVKEVINDLADRLKVLEEAKTTSETELAAVKAQLSATEKENGELKEKLTKLSKEPIMLSVKKSEGKVTTEKEKPTKSWYTMSLAERIANPEANPKFAKLN